ncbi:uncharacterized protein JN550_009317 [Neoarthrinium moseri]|uniref:uncharacterized protein n=1 Tax=Neoarthrinium moseri TaxID=1658444 RepID=UPI001FDCACA9|nr:uncharacterized protein JN550_009317 [Neoarthrinium moseri]KAI1863819.1 hypothetical protein JN550_009317 [Neoarthrinium moseri]
MFLKILTLLVLISACSALAARPDIESSHYSVRGTKLSVEQIAARDDGAPELILIQRQTNSTDDGDKPTLLGNATISDIDKARALVAEAIKQATEHNKARLAKPMRNRYTVDPSTKHGKRQNEDVAPLFNITDAIRAAAALVAEADAYEDVKNGTAVDKTIIEAKRQNTGNWWMGNLAHSGGWPWGSNPSNFKVFRNVKTDYGAAGDGVTDDTQAIINAVKDAKACGPGCYSSTTKGAIIYFPPGTYLISSTIETYYGTQFVGDAVNRPIIKASASFVSLGVISTNHYVENGGTGSDGNAKQWYINTANFYRQIRNFVIDIRAVDQNAYVAALHYQVAQATSLQFVDFICTQSSTTTQQAIYAENGSGGFMSDLTFTGGAFGIYGGNQQFTSQRLRFNNFRTAVQLIWDWGWVWKSIRVENCGTAFRLMGENGVHNTGSFMLVDSTIKAVTTAIFTFPYTGTTGDATTGITLDNVKFDGVTNGVWDGSKSYLAGSTTSIDTWVQGRVYSGTTQNNALSVPFSTPRDKTLTGGNPDNLPKAPFFEKAKPQYLNVGSGSFIHMRSACKGDGKSDDTACFQRVLNSAGSSVVYVDAGTYMISDTISVPKDINIVGEAWSQIAAFGTAFGDVKKPKPLLRVGEPGEIGNVEMQDLIFTSKGNTPGLTFVEWNVRAESAGSAGMWDCHVRVGGAKGTDLESSNCPAKTSGTNTGCSAGSMMMHITSQASGYFENVWLWVADHNIDDPDWDNDNNFMTQCSVYVGRGLLVESTNPVWLYGTASEHAVIYQYQFSKARHVYASMIQTESPYYQPNPAPPAPVKDSVGVFNNDPDYVCSGANPVGCDASWALRILESSSVTIHGAGLYSWFSTYTQACVDTMDCQDSLIQFRKNTGNVVLHNLVTIGSVNMIESDGSFIRAKDNLAVDFHPYWSQIAAYDARQVSPGICQEVDDKTWINPDIPQGDWDTLRIMEDEEQLVYFTIVNGCPYDFVFTGGNDWQLENDWSKDFITIPAGESAQFLVEMEFMTPSDKPSDTAGEAYYRIATTDKTWHVTADWVDDKDMVRNRIAYDGLSTKNVAKGNIIDLDWPSLDYDRGLTNQWVLTGSEQYGYWSSTNPPVAWMKSILPIIGDRMLKHVCIPGSHDAGMSKIDGHTGAGTASNTQTQVLDIYGQLLKGSRWFDVRPCLGNGGAQHLCHYSTVAGVSQGGNGIKVDEAIDMVNHFMRDHPGELVILDLNNDCGYDTDAGSLDYPRLTADQWAPIWKKFRDNIENPCKRYTDIDPDLTSITMNDYIGDGVGCVLTLARSIPGVSTSEADPAKGFYHSNSFPRIGDFSSTDDMRTLAEDQVAKMTMNRAIKGDGAAGNHDSFFVLHWETTISFDTLDIPIAALAAQAQSSLFWYAYHMFTPYSYPSVLYVDMLGAPFRLGLGWTQEEYLAKCQGHLVAMAMAVNLYIAGENCNIGGNKIH